MQPHSVYPTWTVEADVNFVAHEKGLETRPITLKSEGVEPNAKGRKWVRKGAFIDKDGKVTTPTVTQDNVTFDSEPVGFLFHSVDVTYGDAHAALMYAGTVWGDWLNWGEEYDWDVKYGEAVCKILPQINFTDHKGNFVEGAKVAGGGGGAAAAATTVDLSKATGTLAIDKGGTGATSASEALDALLESQPLSVENGGTGKGTASEALDALLESQPLPIEKGGTGASDKDAAVTNLGAQKAE